MEDRRESDNHITAILPDGTTTADVYARGLTAGEAKARTDARDGLMKRSHRLRLAGFETKASALDEVLVDMSAGTFPPKEPTK